MNKMLLEIEYNKFIVCASTKDERVLLDILSRAKIAKRNWGDPSVTYYTEDIPKIVMVDGATILAEESILVE